MNRSMLRISIYLANLLLIIYVAGFILMVYLTITKLPYSDFAHVGEMEKIGIWGFPIMLISTLLIIMIVFLLRQILVKIYRTNPFTEKVIPYLKYLKYSLIGYLVIQCVIYFVKNIIESKIGLSFEHELLFVLVALIFIDIYQQSINTYKEHQLTI